MRGNGTLPAALLSGRLVTWVSVNVEKPKTSKLSAPRGDIDNYIKLIFDCCSGYLWDDDAQIEMMSANKVWADDKGHVDIWVKELLDEHETN